MDGINKVYTNGCESYILIDGELYLWWGSLDRHNHKALYQHTKREGYDTVKSMITSQLPSERGNYAIIAAAYKGSLRVTFSEGQWV